MIKSAIHEIRFKNHYLCYLNFRDEALHKFFFNTPFEAYLYSKPRTAYKFFKKEKIKTLNLNDFNSNKERFKYIKSLWQNLPKENKVKKTISFYFDKIIENRVLKNFFYFISLL
jgi:hypothetical protein